MAKACKAKTNNIRCFRCKKLGHIASRCDTQEKASGCTICKKTNHDEKDCYFRKDKNKGNNKKIPFLIEQQTADASDWIVDSGSTSHMVNDISALQEKKRISSEIMLAKKGRTMKADGIGRVELDTCILKDVLHVPELAKNLLSVSAIMVNGGEVIFGGEVKIKKGDNTSERSKKLERSV